MNNREIDYPAFLKFVHNNFAEEISLDKVQEILDLPESYNKDSPESLGKRLIISRLKVSGVKNSGEPINFDHKMSSGVNLWLADNGKGKSTIFKLIKFGLTGVDSVKKDVKPWVEELLLEFKIGQVTYVSFVDRRGRDRGALFRTTIDELLKLKELNKLGLQDNIVEFEFKSASEMEGKLQSFFFDEFSYYSLKYTQHDSRKDVFDLRTSNLSWSTYFKSLYLESKDYAFLFFENEGFGHQGRKIFEMILGLPLTYPINFLGLQRDSVLENLGRLKLVNRTSEENKGKLKKELSNRLSEIKKELGINLGGTNFKFDERPLLEEYQVLQKKVNEKRKLYRDLNDQFESLKSRKKTLETEITNFHEDEKSIEVEVGRLEKQDLNIKLYIDAGSFFSNLDIEKCPHCEVEVTPIRKEEERENHVCSLCGEKSQSTKIDVNELNEKSAKIRREVKDHSKKLTSIAKNQKKLSLELEKINTRIPILYEEVIKSAPLESENKRLRDIELEIEKIHKERNKKISFENKKEKLISEKAVVEFRLGELEGEKNDKDTKRIQELELERRVLDHAISLLAKKRIHLNKDVLGKLEGLILNEVKEFGLSNISEVTIDDSYNLILKQNDVHETFRDLNEGEKLRVKLAFYLSLIQLDIEFNLGRHPRFLIFDSPGSEEMVPKHLSGLSQLLGNVNQRFGDKLQIFVGSALREFSEITTADRTLIKNEEEYVF